MRPIAYDTGRRQKSPLALHVFEVGKEAMLTVDSWGCSRQGTNKRIVTIWTERDYGNGDSCFLLDIVHEFLERSW